MAGLSPICGDGDLVAALWLTIARRSAMPVVAAFGAVRFQVGSAGEQLSWVWVDAGFSLGVGQLRLIRCISAGKGQRLRFSGP